MDRVKKLQIQHLDKEISLYAKVHDAPPTGWIQTVRKSINMTLQQMGKIMGIAASNVLDMERREVDGSISLKTLRNAAAALNMRVVYGFLPNDGSIEKMIENRALIIARKIVSQTDTTMRLEDQRVSRQRLEKSVKELAEEIRNELPKYLWD